MGNIKIALLSLLLTITINISYSQVDSTYIQRLIKFEKKNNIDFEVELNKLAADYLFNQIQEFSENEFGLFSSYFKIYKNIILSDEELKNYYAEIFPKYFNTTDFKRLIYDKVNQHLNSLSDQRNELLKNSKEFKESNEINNLYIEINSLNILSEAPIERAKKEGILEILLSLIDILLLLPPFLLVLSLLGSIKGNIISILISIVLIIISIYLGNQFEKNMIYKINVHVEQYINHNPIKVSDILNSKTNEFYNQKF